LLTRSLSFLEGNTVRARPQDESLATYCPKISREDGHVDWRRPAIELVRMARAYTPWPSLFTIRRKIRVKLLQVSLANRTGARALPGTLLEASSSASPSLVVACGEGAVEVKELQAEGRRALSAAEFVRGEHVVAGEVWGE
jgi:methionyl-tRNA formyltransferase